MVGLAGMDDDDDECCCRYRWCCCGCCCRRCCRKEGDDEREQQKTRLRMRQRRVSAVLDGARIVLMLQYIYDEDYMIEEARWWYKSITPTIAVSSRCVQGYTGIQERRMIITHEGRTKKWGRRHHASGSRLKIPFCPTSSSRIQKRRERRRMSELRVDTRIIKNRKYIS